MNQRQKNLQHWLISTGKLPAFQLQLIPGDASFRRYFRVQLSDKSYIAMDAPPAIENCKPYVAIAEALRKLDLCTPEVIAHDIENGFLLITDFGDRLFLTTLNASNSVKLYGQALSALAILQTCRNVPGMTIPLFTAQVMRQELDLFKEWFLQKHLNIVLTLQTENRLSHCFDFLTQSAKAQTQVFMHRDYHSANLMVLPENQVGILDFQDAFIGPVTYDVVSLLRDCYIAWPDDMVTRLVLQYWEKLQLKDVSPDMFLRWFDLMGLQRHLKALLTFARKYRRDDNANYLKHIPRTLEYIVTVSTRYPECQVLHEIMLNKVMPCVE